MTLGNLLEWYDFILFGFVAGLISSQFFPTRDRYTGLLLSTGTFAAGFVFRPLGGVMIGLYADRRGRKQALLLVFQLMTVATALVAFCPPYARIGIWAPLLVVLSRVLQGISAGGEFGVATSALVEQALPGRRNLFGSLQIAAQCLGALLAASMGALLTVTFTAEVVNAWAWRVPFILGLLIAPVGLYLRRNMIEPARPDAVGEQHRWTLREALTRYPSELIEATALSAALNVMSYVLIVYLPLYAVENLKLPAWIPFTVLVLTLTVRLLTVPVFAIVADRYGGRSVSAVALAVFLLILYPAYYWMTHAPGFGSLALSEILFVILMSAFSAPVATLSADLFPAALRSTALSISYNAGAALLGGVAPFVLTWLTRATGDVYWPAHYCACFFCLALFALLRRRGPPGANANLLQTG